jgi:glycerol-3-phosphate dehydrogenase
MSDRVDLLIAGAGIYGVSAAYEACRRGLSVLLVDRGDIGGGASTNSLKVAHGGLRYLQSLDLRRSFESIRERRRLLRIAPAFVRPLPVRMDLAGRGLGYRLALRAGLVANELLSLHRNRGLPPEQHLPRARYPGWYDALIESPEQVILAFLHGAEAAAPGRLSIHTYGALRRVVHEAGRLVAAEVDGRGSVATRAVLRCTGGHEGSTQAVLAMNLVFDALPLCADGRAVGLANPVDGRNAFAVPWRDRCMIGTYNRRYPLSPEEPLHIDRAWIDECLDWVRQAHPSLAGLRRADVRLVHAGLLPAAPGRADEPAGRFAIETRPDGTLAVRGVKWTTAVGVSRLAVERVLRELDQPARPRPPDAALPDPRQLLAGFRAEDPAREAPLLPGRAAPLRGDVLFAVERQWARTLEDVLLRRLDLASGGHPGQTLVRAAAAFLAEHLGWSEAEARAQVTAFDESIRFGGHVPNAIQAAN